MPLQFVHTPSCCPFHGWWPEFKARIISELTRDQLRNAVAGTRGVHAHQVCSLQEGGWGCGGGGGGGSFCFLNHRRRKNILYVEARLMKRLGGAFYHHQVLPTFPMHVKSSDGTN